MDDGGLFFVGDKNFTVMPAAPGYWVYRGLDRRPRWLVRFCMRVFFGLHWVDHG